MILGTPPRLTAMTPVAAPAQAPLMGQPVTSSPYVAAGLAPTQAPQASNPLSGLNTLALANILRDNQTPAQKQAGLPDANGTTGPTQNGAGSFGLGAGLRDQILGSYPGPNYNGGTGIKGMLGSAWQHATGQAGQDLPPDAYMKAGDPGWPYGPGAGTANDPYNKAAPVPYNATLADTTTPPQGPLSSIMSAQNAPPTVAPQDASAAIQAAPPTGQPGMDAWKQGVSPQAMQQLYASLITGS